MFSEDRFRQALSERYDVVHIAGHFVLEPGSEYDSFLLLGNGEKLTLAELRAEGFVFDNVALLVLSACQTAIGGADAFGREIEGLGALGQNKGAQAVLASLWAVADSSTGELMRNFYKHRIEGGMTKAAALQGAQLTLLRGETNSENAPDELSRGVIPLDHEETFHPPRRPPYAHPYYWAPFVLYGNWR